MNIIIDKKIAYYTKDALRVITIMAIGLFIIIALIAMKYKSVYEVCIDGEQIGFVSSKDDFEKNIQEELFNNSNKNIAFTDINVKKDYKFKMVEKNINTNEEEILSYIVDNSNITYYRYAINVNNEPKEYVNTFEEAEQIVNNLKEELVENNIELSILKVYETDNKIDEEIKIASVEENLIQAIEEKEEEINKIKNSTVNGIYLSQNPVVGSITSRYGAREAIRNHSHQGLDIAAKTGTKIVAVAAGTITYAGVCGGYGNLIKIDHGNGVESYYGHCSKINVKVGQKVEAGELIGLVGSTGNSTGSHLHLEIRLNGEVLDPLNYLYN